MQDNPSLLCSLYFHLYIYQASFRQLLHQQHLLGDLLQRGQTAAFFLPALGYGKETVGNPVREKLLFCLCRLG